MRKRFLFTLFLLMLMSISAFTICCSFHDRETTSVINLSSTEAYALIIGLTGDPDLVILDIRTPDEFVRGHIQNAINIDFLSENFRARLGILDRKKTYLVYCRTGVQSASAIEIMKELKFRKIYHMEDGIAGWEKEGLTTVK